MSMSVVYTNFCGMIVSETRGGVERDYVPDTSGSTAALVDSTQTITDRWEYWPYGEVSQRTGTNTTPFTFVGMLGYFKDLLDKLLYVRARHVKPNAARWLTVDPLWPDEAAFAYCNAAPVDCQDPSGNLPIQAIICGASCLAAGGCAAGVWIACGQLWGEPEFWECAIDFFKDLPLHSQIGCIAGLVGCLYCVGKYVCTRPCTPAERALYQDLVRAACKSGSISCKGNMTCSQLRVQTSKLLACIGARLLINYRCFGGGSPGHQEAVENLLKGLAKCAGFMKAKGCAPFGRN